jgi:hypothetical protein
MGSLKSNTMNYKAKLLLFTLGAICGLSLSGIFDAQRILTLSNSAFAQTMAAQPSDGAGRWHLVRTPGPDKSGDIVSVMHTADALQSDPDFAGIAIRCLPKGALQIAFVLITPFPPRTHPQFTVSGNHNQVRFKGEAIASGTMVVLPGEAEVLAKGPWQSAATLAVDIEKGAAAIHGAVQLNDLKDAIGYLRSNSTNR